MGYVDIKPLVINGHVDPSHTETATTITIGNHTHILGRFIHNNID